MNPLISVLLPVRNAGRTLPAALRCLCRQEKVNLEIIVADDGSTDDSGRVAERAGAKDARIRVLRLPPRGLVPTLNSALADAEGDLIGRMDADDLCTYDRFHTQLQHLRRHPHLDVLGSRVRLFPDRLVTRGMLRFATWQNRLLTHRAMARNLLVETPLMNATGLYRRSALDRIGGWREFPGPEDQDLWLRGVAAGWRLGKVNRTLYFWREHPERLTRKSVRYAREAFRATAIEAYLREGHHEVTIWGWADSLTVWQDRLTAKGITVAAIPVSAKRLRGGASLPDPPEKRGRRWLLAYGAVRSRETLETHLLRERIQPGRDYVFVS